jgi:hypothetical protein
MQHQLLQTKLAFILYIFQKDMPLVWCNPCNTSSWFLLGLSSPYLMRLNKHMSLLITFAGNILLYIIVNWIHSLFSMMSKRVLYGVATLSHRERDCRFTRLTHAVRLTLMLMEMNCLSKLVAYGCTTDTEPSISTY